MPWLDLRDPENPTAFHKLAAFMVLSIMLWPDDQAMRAKFMARLERDTGLTPKRKPRLKSDEIWLLINRALTKGRAAGNILGILIDQFHELSDEQRKRRKRTVSLNRAIDVCRRELNPHEYLAGENWKVARNSLGFNRDRQAIQVAFKKYRTVAHLILAGQIAVQQEQKSWLPTRNEFLPAFSELAEHVITKSTGIFLYDPLARIGAHKQPVLPLPRIWRLRLPDQIAK